MSNPDKHKPLSAEELFKLLDNTSNKVNDFDELDDFEKEALEGFSAHSNSQKAKALTEELNTAISKKVTDSHKGGSKNKIIWFSAAASIVLVIMLSVFFFNQTKEDSASNLALNEIKEEKKPTPVLAEPSAPLETVTGSATNTPEKTENIVQGKTKFQEIVSNKIAEGESAAGLVSESSIVALEKSKNEFALDIATKDESKARTENDDRDKDQQKLAEVLTDKMDAKKKEKNSLAQEQANSELQANQNVTTTTANNTKSTKEEVGYYKADDNRAVAATQSLEKEKAISTGTGSKTKQAADSFDKANAGPESYAKNAAAPSSVSVADNKTMNAYYTGSELAIRDYILEFLAKKSSSAIITGKYKIIGNVSAKGELSVITIIQISNENCHCTEQIKEALNSMTKWNPAVEDGKKSSSRVEFIIAF